jgi:cell division protein FtsB
MVICLAVSAQAKDTVLVKQVNQLEKQTQRLKNSNWSLQKKVKQLEEHVSLIKQGAGNSKGRPCPAPDQFG